MTKKKSSKKSQQPQRQAPPKAILLPDAATKLVFIDISFQSGSVADPAGKSGLASLMASMLLRGTKRKDAKKFHHELDNLGGELYLGKYMESIRIMGEVLAENADAFVDLIAELLSEPGFREEEFLKLQTQTLSLLQDEMGSDGDIAERRFQEYALAGHPYARITSGSLRSIPRITVSDCEQFYRQHCHRGVGMVAATGGLTKKKLEAIAARIEAAMNPAGEPSVIVSAPEFLPGRRLVMLDKPERTQSQIYIASPGVSQHDPLFHALAIGSHVFGGGSFSAWLMREVREKRGWSYGAYGGFRSARNPLYFSMHTTPSNKDTGPAVALMLELFEKLAKKGISKAEFTFAKQSLVNQSAFLQDTLKKRVNNKVSEVLLGLPKGFYDQYQAKLRKVTHAQVQAALKQRLKPKDLFLLVLGTVDAWKGDLLPVLPKAVVEQYSFTEEPSVIFGEN